jgi:hypothetical protein
MRPENAFRPSWGFPEAPQLTEDQINEYIELQMAFNPTLNCFRLYMLVKRWLRIQGCRYKIRCFANHDHVVFEINGVLYDGKGSRYREVGPGDRDYERYRRGVRTGCRIPDRI